MIPLDMIRAETGITDEKTLKELQLRIEELAVAVWHVFDKNRTYLSEQDQTVDAEEVTTQNGGRK